MFLSMLNHFSKLPSFPDWRKKWLKLVIKFKMKSVKGNKARFFLFFCFAAQRLFVHIVSSIQFKFTVSSAALAFVKVFIFNQLLKHFMDLQAVA